MPRASSPAPAEGESEMSFRYQIAFVVICLQAVTVAAMLLQSSETNVTRAAAAIREADAVLFSILAEGPASGVPAVSGSVLQQAEQASHLDRVVLLGPDGLVRVSSVAAELGNPPSPGILDEQPLPDGGAIAVRRVGSAAEEQALGDALQSLHLGIVMVVLTSIAALLMSGLVGRRLERLSDGASQVASGDFNVEVESDGSDEIAGVGKAFNFMVHTIRQDLVALQQEIEDRKHTEVELEAANVRIEDAGKLLRDALENIPYGVIAVDEDGAVELFNRTASEMFGFETGSTIGTSVDALVPMESRNDFRALYQGGRAGDRITSAEIIGQRAGGELFPLQVAVSEVPTVEDNREQVPRTILIAVIDLTATKELQNQLAQSQRLEAVGGLTGGIAHDFNNILHVIMSSLDVLNMEPDPVVAKELRGQAFKAANRGSELVKKLMVFARSRTIEATVVDLVELVDGMREMLTRTISEDIDLSFEIDDSVAAVKVDRSTMENIVLNLCINGRDAMPQGGRMTVAVASVDCTDEPVLDRDGNEIRGCFTTLRVSDTGMGMSPALLKRAFEPYFSTKEVGQGSGLGLSMVYGFVHENRGHILVDSTVGMGTSIALFLPEHAAGPYEVELRREGEGEVRPGDHERVLVVEDDPDVRKLTVRLLSDLNYEVVEATDGPAALRKLEELDRDGLEVDVVVSDVVMPFGMSGIDLSIAIWGRYPNTPVVLTSGYPEQVLKDAGLSEEDLRDIHLIRKPFSRKTLASTLAEVLQW